jgi:hypothetical protein
MPSSKTAKYLTPSKETCEDLTMKPIARKIQQPASRQIAANCILLVLLIERPGFRACFALSHNSSIAKIGARIAAF